MINPESITVSISAILFLAGLALDNRSQWRYFYQIGTIATLIDLVFVVLMEFPFVVHPFWYRIDFFVYYVGYGLLFCILWVRSEPSPSDPKFETLLIIMIGLLISFSIMYIISGDELFLILALLFFATIGTISSFHFFVNSKKDLHPQLGNFSGIILLLSSLLYPSFIFNQAVFFTSLLLFYLGWIPLIVNLILHSRSGIRLMKLLKSGEIDG